MTLVGDWVVWLQVPAAFRNMASVPRKVWCVWSADRHNRDCALFETRDGALRYVCDVPQTQVPSPLDQFRTRRSLQLHIEVAHTSTATESDPIWVFVTHFGAYLHGTLADALVHLIWPSPPPATIEDVWKLHDSQADPHGHPDLPKGAMFKPRHDNCWQGPFYLYRRFVQPDGAAYCAKVVEQVAADGVLPVVGVPELVAEFL
jgi:hypothetical protein